MSRPLGTAGLSPYRSQAWRGPEFTIQRSLPPTDRIYPNVLIICIDALRRDHVVPEIMPWLSSYANAGKLWTNMRLQTEQKWTVPSVAAMFYGYDAQAGGNAAARNKDKPNIADWLSETHYTGVFLGNPVFRHWGKEWLFRGFDTVRGADPSRGNDWQAAYLPSLWSWFRAWQRPLRDGPWFAYMHCYEVHAPYLPGRMIPVPSTAVPLNKEIQCQVSRGYWPTKNAQGYMPPEFHAYYRDRYRAWCRHTDSILARLIPHVEDGRTAILIVSDHGEALGENDAWGHGPTEKYDIDVITDLFFCLREPRLVAETITADTSNTSLVEMLADLLDRPLPFTSESPSRYCESSADRQAVARELVALGYVG